MMDQMPFFFANWKVHGAGNFRGFFSPVGVSRSCDWMKTTAVSPSGLILTFSLLI